MDFRIYYLKIIIITFLNHKKYISHYQVQHILYITYDIMCISCLIYFYIFLKNTYLYKNCYLKMIVPNKFFLISNFRHLKINYLNKLNIIWLIYKFYTVFRNLYNKQYLCMSYHHIYQHIFFLQQNIKVENYM